MGVVVEAVVACVCPTQAYKCKRDGCGFDSIFSFPRSGNKVERGVESAMPSEFGVKWETEVF